MSGTEDEADRHIWHIAVWVRDGDEAGLHALLERNGFEVYRMWPVTVRTGPESS